MSAGEVLALDPATKTGVAYGSPGSAPELQTVNFGSEDSEPEDVYERATFWLADFLLTRKPELFVIEYVVPPHSARGFTNANTTMVTIGLYAIFTGLARCKRIEWRRAQMRAWRKHFLGKGDLNTDQAKRGALVRCRQLGWNAPDHNAAEAAGIWDWGCAQLKSATLFEHMKW